MSGFLNYVDAFESKIRKSVTTKAIIPEKEISTPKILSLQVEVCTIEGAQKVIDKLQEWISKQGGTTFVEKTIDRNEKELVKSKFKIPPKKVVKDKIQETRSRAMDILDGLPEEPTINESLLLHQTNSINNQEQSNFSQDSKPNIETVAGHASALL